MHHPRRGQRQPGGSAGTIDCLLGRGAHAAEAGAEEDWPASQLRVDRGGGMFEGGGEVSRWVSVIEGGEEVSREVSVFEGDGEIQEG